MATPYTCELKGVTAPKTSFLYIPPYTSCHFGAVPLKSHETLYGRVVHEIDCIMFERDLKLILLKYTLSLVSGQGSMFVHMCRDFDTLTAGKV